MYNMKLLLITLTGLLRVASSVQLQADNIVRQRATRIQKRFPRDFDPEEDDINDDEVDQNPLASWLPGT